MSNIKGKATINWKSDPIKHEHYTDLGHYVIDMGEIDAEEFAKGAAMANEKVDTLKTRSCTGIAKKNSKGEVIMGRNQDEDVSNYPVMIFHLTGGKYQAVSFFYMHKFDYSYADFQKGLDLKDGFRGMIASVSTDAFNEAGLYIQTNMRTNVGVTSYGTNPGGERTPMIGVSARVVQNASTVAEALDYIKTLDVFTLGSSPNATWDYAFMIGDATGEYGIIEFASDQMYYTPYANGHCNAFVSPALAGLDTYGCGLGRLNIAQQASIGAETARDMMEAVHKADWYHEIQDFEYAYKAENGRVYFVDKDGNPSIDWRSEFTMLFAVDDFGNYVPEDYTAIEYLDMVSNYLTGMNLSKLLTDEENLEITPEIQAEIDRINSELNIRYHRNCTKMWLMNDENFEQVKEAGRKLFEMMDAFNLLEKFMAGDKQPLRDAGIIFTTGMNFGVNCAQKYLIVRFQEDEEAIYEYQW